MQRRPELEKLPSGKAITRWFDRAGQLASEMHSYDDPKDGRSTLMIALKFENGRKVREMYAGQATVDGKLVPYRVIRREEYERRRLEYPDMPAADVSVVDESAEHIEEMEREQRERVAAASALGMDAGKLTEFDLHCAKLMQTGRRADAVEWIRSEGHTLGEMDHAASRRLVAKLVELGATAVFACEIDSYEGGLENTGHLVVELPGVSAARKALRRELARLAREQGFDPDPDKGQRFSYVKLD